MKDRTAQIAVLMVCVSILAIGFIRYYNQQSRTNVLSEAAESQNHTLSLLAHNENDHVYGSSTAQVRLIMYSDTDCRYCRRLYPKLKNIVDTSNGLVSLTYRHIPIYYYRGEVDESELAGACVARQLSDKGFFRYLDALFARLPEGVETHNIDTEIVLTSATDAGMAEDEVKACLAESYGQSAIESQHQSGGVLGIIIVPHTFMVYEDNYYSIGYNRAEFVYRTLIDKLLSGTP